MDSWKYVVLDVETNGLSSKTDDLLSISIYKPDDGSCYNRFLPLEMQKRVYTTEINGITNEMLKGLKPIKQDEIDKIIDQYELDKRIILTYGSIDEKFIRSYMKRKKLYGFEKMNFYNFKKNIISSSFSSGNITKDNLCDLFKVNGVTKIHSGLNDCILEWKLFEKMNNNLFLVTQNDVFLLNDDYIIPASYLDTYPNFKYHIDKHRIINFTDDIIYTLAINDYSIIKFPTNMTGIALEHLINKMLNVKENNPRPFLIENKRKMTYIGELFSFIEPIYITPNDNGTLNAVDEKDKDLINQINQVTLKLKEQIEPLIDYIKNNIFHDTEIIGQELIINKEDNVLAICDLSDKDTVLEIKTYLCEPKKHLNQLYYQSNGRDTYLLCMNWEYGEITLFIKKIEFYTHISKRSEKSKIEKIKDLMIDKSVEPTTIYLNEHIGLHCKICGYNWESTKQKALKIDICPNCHPKKLKSNTPKNKEIIIEDTHKRALDKIKTASNGKVECVEYLGSRSNCTLKCLDCGKIWRRRYDHFLRSPTCPLCRAKIKQNP